MFTGIITDVGILRQLDQRGDLRARIETHYETAMIDIGASIACDGVCLTVVALGPNWFDVDISAETVSKTNLGTWAEGRRINLERALRVGDELGGHIVSGHVDGVARVVALQDEGDSTRVTLRAPEALERRSHQLDRAVERATDLLRGRDPHSDAPRRAADRDPRRGRLGHDPGQWASADLLDWP